MAYKSGMSNRSPSGDGHRSEAMLRQKGMSNSSPSAVEPKPKGPSVDAEATRSSVGQAAPTIGPRTA